MKNITLELVFSIDSEEHMNTLYTSYFNGDLQKIILESLFNKKEILTETNDSKDMEKQLTEILNLLKSNSYVPNDNSINMSAQPNVIHTNKDNITNTRIIEEKPKADTIKEGTTPPRKRPAGGGLFSKKTISRS